MMRLLRFLFDLCLIWLGFLSPAFAEYPDKPLHIYVPFAAGGASESLMRTIAPRMELILKQKINIYANDSKITAVQAIRNSVSLPADGYHFVIGNLGTHGSAPALNKIDLGYNPEVDFSPVGMLGETPLYLIVRQDLPVRHFNDLVSYLRKHQETITMASSGKGSTTYLAELYFNSLIKINPTIVPYAGSDPALKDLAYGYVDVMIDQSTSALPFIQSRLVRGIAYTARQDDDISDIALQSQIPSFKKVGLPEFDITGWNILFAPRGTSKAHIALINKALREALKDTIIRANLHLKDTILYPDSRNIPEYLQEFIRTEIKRWAEIINISKS